MKMGCTLDGVARRGLTHIPLSLFFLFPSILVGNRAALENTPGDLSQDLPELSNIPQVELKEGKEERTASHSPPTFKEIKQNNLCGTQKRILCTLKGCEGATVRSLKKLTLLH